MVNNLSLTEGDGIGELCILYMLTDVFLWTALEREYNENIF